jgi:hypothetical protein
MIGDAARAIFVTARKCEKEKNGKKNKTNTTR